MSRQEKIVAWLAKSSLANHHSKGDGFFVSRGGRVKLSSGIEKEILSWLFEEGIVDPHVKALPVKALVWYVAKLAAIVLSG